MDTRETPRLAAVFKIAFAVLVQAIAFGVTYNSSAAFFTAEDLTGIAAAGAAVNVALLWPALLPLAFPSSPFVARMRWAVNGWLALVTLGGVFGGYVMHTELYAAGPSALLIGALAAAAFALFVGFLAIDGVRASGLVLNLAALVSVTITLSAHLSAQGKHDPAQTSTPDHFANIRALTFTETPNIYFLSFDGLAPRSLMKKHLGLDTTELHDLVDTHFRRLPNFFSNAMLTSESLDMLLSLDEEVWERGVRLYQTVPGHHSGLFNGVRPSPLFHLLTDNGYTINTLIPDAHFGHLKGPYIDHYHTLSTLRLVCYKSGAGDAPLAFWGYCGITGGSVGSLSHAAAQFGDGGAQADFLAERIAALDRRAPQFLLSYLYLPGHFPNKHRFDNAQQIVAYRKVVIEKTQRTARAMEEILAHLKRHDPNAIVLLFGDHGMLHNAVGRSVPTAFGALGAVYPRTRCAAELDAATDKGYTTILDAAHAILRCVSDGQSALVTPRARKNNVMGAINIADRNITFGNFRYE